jgi:predicted MPP superfamily phosphohydrolase
MLMRDILPLAVLKPLYFIGTSWLGMMMYLFAFFVITDIIFIFIRKKYRKLRFILIYITVLSLVIYGYINFNNPKIVTQEINIEKNVENRREYTVVGISDLHLGMGIGKNRLKRYIELINAQKPDMVLIAGDIIDNTVRPLMEEKMYEEFLQINAPVYACLGNHEYMGDSAQCREFYRLAGIRLLVDETILADSAFWIIGRDDYKFNPSRMSLAELVAQTDKSMPVILLDHEPHHLEEAETAGVDLQFSGHTHNGQMFPGNLITKHIFELSHGYKRRGSTHYFVSSGLGIWGPLFRIGTDSEVAVFRIVL